MFRILLDITGYLNILNLNKSIRLRVYNIKGPPTKENLFWSCLQVDVPNLCALIFSAPGVGLHSLIL